VEEASLVLGDAWLSREPTINYSDCFNWISFPKYCCPSRIFCPVTIVPKSVPHNVEYGILEKQPKSPERADSVGVDLSDSEIPSVVLFILEHAFEP
jgi:hypothetical protein